MRRGTTPFFSIKVKGSSLADSKIEVVIRQEEVVITKRADELQVNRGDGTATIHFGLTQVETLAFKPGKANLQLRWIKSSGAAYASDYVSIRIKDILDGKVIRYE